jgi:TRAP-type mannitol/chloroaromatic compound transport system substrate-binding protein
MRKCTRIAVVMGTILVSLSGCEPPASPVEHSNASLSATQIPMRVFSTSPTLGMTLTSVTDPQSPKYGALGIFTDKVAEYTHGAVAFSPTQWNANSGKSVIEQVGISGDGRDAAYDNGGALNPVWGFMYNSLPFGLDFERMVTFLYERGGLALAQSLVDKKGLNVKVLPVVGSEPQGSGYLKHPVGKVYCNGEADCKKESSIGLAGICQAGWTWRYLPPAQSILDGACDQMVTDGEIASKSIHFVSSVPGTTVVGAVQQGSVTAFEFATALDDADPATGFFPDPPSAGPITQAYQNPGHKGLRFYHTPSWHQPFYLGWVLINKSAVWDGLSSDVQFAIEQASKDALLESFGKSGSVQCDALKRMFTANDDQVQLDTLGNPMLVAGKPVSADLKWSEWPKDAIDRLQAATTAYLESLKGGASPTVDQQDFATVIGSLRAFMADIHYKWKPNKFEYPAKACPQPMPL